MYKLIINNLQMTNNISSVTEMTNIFAGVHTITYDKIKYFIQNIQKKKRIASHKTSIMIIQTPYVYSTYTYNKNKYHENIYPQILKYSTINL